MSKLYKSKAFLYQRYVIEKKTVTEIAKECGCSAMTIDNWLGKFNLKRDVRTWTR